MRRNMISVDAETIASQMRSNGCVSVSTMIPPKDFQEENMSTETVATPSDFGMKLQQAIDDKEKETGEKLILRSDPSVEMTSNEEENTEVVSEVSNKPFKSLDPSVRYRRLDSYAFKKRSTRNLNIANRSLDIFLNAYYNRRHIDEEFVVFGVTDRNERPNVTKECVWDEGGFDGKLGHALIVTDEKGFPVIPNFVYHNSTIYNSRHALVPVTVGNFIIFGGKDVEAQRSIVAVYRVIDIDTNTPNVPKFKVHLVAYMTEGVWQKFEEEDTIWSEDSDAIVAIIERLNEENAKRACYIRRYRERRLDVNDMNDILSDNEFMSTCQEVSSVEEAYQHAAAALTGHFDQLDKSVYPGMYVAVTMDENEVVKIYFIGCLYNVIEHTSKGNRLFINSVTLSDNGSFSYPDRYLENVMSVEDIKKNLKTSSSVVTFFRRISE